MIHKHLLNQKFPAPIIIPLLKYHAWTRMPLLLSTLPSPSFITWTQNNAQMTTITQLANSRFRRTNHCQNQIARSGSKAPNQCPCKYSSVSTQFGILLPRFNRVCLTICKYTAIIWIWMVLCSLSWVLNIKDWSWLR